MKSNGLSAEWNIYEWILSKEIREDWRRKLENLRDLFFWSHCLACGAKNLDLTGVGITIWGTWRGIVPAVQYKAVWRVYNK